MELAEAFDPGRGCLSIHTLWSAYDTSGEIEIGARIVGVVDDAIAAKTTIMAQLSGEPGGCGKHMINRAQTVPRSLLGVVIS